MVNEVRPNLRRENDGAVHSMAGAVKTSILAEATMAD